MIKQVTAMSFSSPYVERRTAKSTFYKQINQLIDWSLIENEIAKYYSPGKSATGQAAYPGVLLFKMLLVGYWMGGLSDRLVEEAANENLSVMCFLGLSLEDSVPDHSVLSRFRTQLTKHGGFDPLLKAITDQLDTHGVVVNTGVKVDASLTASPRKPKGKTTYAICEDRKEDSRDDQQSAKEEGQAAVLRIEQPGVDSEARWTKKAGKLCYGFKKHHLTDEQGLVLSVTTTAANRHDSKELEALLDKVTLPKNSRVYADKAYKSKDHDQLIKERTLKNGIHHKAVRGKALNHWQKEFNRIVSKSRYTVERTFGGQVKWLGAGVAKYVGLNKTHSQHVLEGIAYNLKRLPRLWIEKQTAPCIG